MTLPSHARLHPLDGRGWSPSSQSPSARKSCNVVRYAVTNVHTGQPARNKFDPGLRRDGPNQLWVIDITEHPTREGKLYCCVVIDVFSRWVVGWAIDSSQ